MEPIRVLCVFSSLDRGGAESMCMNLYRNIDRSKVQFDFVKHTSVKCAFEDEIASLGGRIYTAPRYKMYNYIQYTTWWKRFLHMHPEYQIIHGHFFTISEIYLGIAHRLGRYTIGHIHASASDDGIKGYIKEKNIHRIEKVADACFACSEEAGKWAYKKAQFTVLNNAIESERFAFNPVCRKLMREQLGIRDDDKAIFVVANITEVKNPLGTIDIFNVIQQKNPNAYLLWAGDGNMRGCLEKRINSECIPHVVFLGTRSDVPDLLQAADVFMLCSFNEGLGMAAIEAQASGLPCLLSEGIPREADITGLCSFLPLEQPDKWEKAYSKMLQNTRIDTRKQVRTAGYEVKQTAKWLTEFYLQYMGE